MAPSLILARPPGETDGSQPPLTLPSPLGLRLGGEEILQAEASRPRAPLLGSNLPASSAAGDTRGQVASDAFTASEQKLAAAHQALLHTKGLQLDFKAAPPQPQPPLWLEGFLQALAQLAPILKFLFWGGLVVGAALILWFVANEVLATQRKKAPAAAAPADWRPEPERARALLEEADRLAEAGRFDEAIHILLFRSIDDLTGRRPGLIRPALTSRDIAGLDQMPTQARGAFARIAERVERSFFGGRPVGSEDFAHARGDYETFAFSEGWS